MYDLIKGGVLDAELVNVAAGNAAVTGAYQSMKNVNRRHILLAMSAGLATETPTFVLQQAKDAAGTGVKVLPLTKLYVKVGAGDWEQIDSISRQSPSDGYDTSADDDGTGVLQVCAVVDDETLDDDFTHVRINVAAVGGTTRRATVMQAVGERSYVGEVA